MKSCTLLWSPGCWSLLIYSSPSEPSLSPNVIWDQHLEIMWHFRLHNFGPICSNQQLTNCTFVASWGLSNTSWHSKGSKLREQPRFLQVVGFSEPSLRWKKTSVCCDWRSLRSKEGHSQDRNIWRRNWETMWLSAYKSLTGWNNLLLPRLPTPTDF